MKLRLLLLIGVVVAGCSQEIKYDYVNGPWKNAYIEWNCDSGMDSEIDGIGECRCLNKSIIQIGKPFYLYCPDHQ